MFADVHIHMILDGKDFRAAIAAHKNAVDDALIHCNLQRYRDCGVTFLRDGGDAWGVSLRAKELAVQYGIDYRTPAFPIYKKGHYGSFIGRGYATMQDYAALLNEAEAEGADFIKLMISGLIDFSQTQVLTEDGLCDDEIRTLIDMAHQRGFAVMVHANGDRAVNAALDVGVESIEHGAFLSESTLLRMKNTLWVPTLSPVGNLIGSGRFEPQTLQQILTSQQKKVRFAHENGVLIGLGSDAGAYAVFHAQAVQHEREYLRCVSDEALQQAVQFVQQRFKRA